ncbi:MAG: PadR family transcriptional regulator [Intrasporangium sp.]|uniref:PadR family transcriptional regulator n=1 Tax=Intrasporangium sp. TaxID=1925024 RepID=UPI0026483B24|nr:PadR family transcriptional regulator [Intrasporangium sp.]MDN5795169.1 PadR family transcriptional regulator [Intrasporangium sp.]
MSVKQGLLALLAEEPMYGARLRSEFEARTGGTWPLNIGQVYTTLARLERDGLVEPVGGPDVEGRISYRLTELGRTAADAWWRTPVDRDSTPRDELVIKLALAVTSPGVDVAAVVQTQRTATLTHLRDLTRLKASAPDEPNGHDLAWQLVLESLLFNGEAEVRWLDHVESTLARHVGMPLSPVPAPADLPDVAQPRISSRKGARA